MSKYVECSVKVGVPLRAAYNQWTQFEDFPQFMEGIREVHQLDATHVRWTVDVGGRLKHWEAEITDQILDRRIAWRSVHGATNAGVVEFRSMPDGETEVMVRMEYEPEGTVEVIGSVLQAARLRISENLLLFKKFMEGRGHETGGWRGEVRNGPRARVIAPKKRH